MSSIALKNIGKRWGETVALDGIELDVAPGSFCVLLGPSGCGKSTTLRIIAGLENASHGQVFIGGRDVTALPPAQRGIAMVFQNYALFPHLSVADNITFGLRVRKLDRAEQKRRLDEAAELLGLQPLLQRKPSQLSGGQQQRVALGRALVAQAAVCLMDEPLSNLDAQLRQEMRQELRELQQRLGLTLVYVTHDQAEAMSMADQVVLLNRGRMEQCAHPRELYARPASTFTAQFIGTPAMNLLPMRDGGVAGIPALRGPAEAAHMGVRPEDVQLGSGSPALVRSLEYLGADVVLRCQIGEHLLSVRASGQTALSAGTEVCLSWPTASTHFFDNGGHRLNP